MNSSELKISNGVNFFLLVIQMFLFFLIVPLAGLAHVEEEHPEEFHQETSGVAELDPVFVAIALGVVIIVGFAIWWFFLKKK